MPEGVSWKGQVGKPATTEVHGYVTNGAVWWKWSKKLNFWNCHENVFQSFYELTNGHLFFNYIFCGKNSVIRKCFSSSQSTLLYITILGGGEGGKKEPLLHTTKQPEICFLLCFWRKSCIRKISNPKTNCLALPELFCLASCSPLSLSIWSMETFKLYQSYQTHIKDSH